MNSDRESPRSIPARAVDAVYALASRVGSEEAFIRRSLAGTPKSGARLLDIGCGLGRFFDVVRSCGLEYSGVDVNPDTVAFNRLKRRQVYHADDFRIRPHEFDVHLLAHIVEHFEHDSLVRMLNRYLPSLKPGGLLIVLTPLAHPGFYDDFDHVKPYNPAALRQLFCLSSPQTKGFGLIDRFEETSLWLKRDPIWHSHRTGRWQHLIAIPLTLLHIGTGRMVGRLTGFGMVLRKLQ